jgi:hypothetical protein
VIVRYINGHNPEDEWLYNDPDIDKAKVIWAHDMEEGNQKLLDYFHDLVEPDLDRTQLVSLRPALTGN